MSSDAESRSESLDEASLLSLLLDDASRVLRLFFSFFSFFSFLPFFSFLSFLLFLSLRLESFFLLFFDDFLEDLAFSRRVSSSAALRDSR